MGTQARRQKFVAFAARRTLAENMLARMEQRFPDAGDLPRALAMASGIGRSTIQRFLDEEVGGSIDTLTQIANALHCELYELLIPGHFQRGRLSRAAHKERLERLPKTSQD